MTEKNTKTLNQYLGKGIIFLLVFSSSLILFKRDAYFTDQTLQKEEKFGKASRVFLYILQQVSI